MRNIVNENLECKVIKKKGLFIVNLWLLWNIAMLIYLTFKIFSFLSLEEINMVHSISRRKMVVIKLFEN